MQEFVANSAIWVEVPLTPYLHYLLAESIVSPIDPL